MPTRSRSFDHWFRGGSVETASRNSTSTPWGSRGSLTAPVIRVRSDHTAKTLAQLSTGGSGPFAIVSVVDASNRSATGGSTLPNVEGGQVGVFGFEIIASAEATVAHLETSSGGWWAGGLSPTLSSANLVGECAGRFGGVVVSQHSQSLTSAGRASSGGSSVDAMVCVEVFTGGVPLDQVSTVALRHALSGVGGMPTGGTGKTTSASAGRSFKYWFRGRSIGDLPLARKGNFARGFRGWLGLPTSGGAGPGQIAGSATGGTFIGGSAVDSIRVDFRTVTEAAVEFGTPCTLTSRRQPAIAGGAVISGGTCDPARGVLREAVAAVEASGSTNLRLTTDERPIAACSVGGGVEPRTDLTSLATARLEASSTVPPRLLVDLQFDSKVGFGAAAHIGVNRTEELSGCLAAATGGASHCVATSVLTASGGTGFGGSLSVAPISLVYHIYSNDGQGGPIDYSAPIAVVSGLEWTSDELSPSASMRYGVRAYDALNGLQEENLDASITLLIDDQGLDATRIPLPPVGLRAIDLGGGRTRIEWASGGDQAPRNATTFHVYVSPEVVTDFSSPRAVVAASTARGRTFAAEVDGLSDGRYSAVVRALNDFGEERNMQAVIFTVDRTPPAQIDDLSASISASIA